MGDSITDFPFHIIKVLFYPAIVDEPVKPVGTMAIREMKMIPDEVGAVGLALLYLCIDVEVGDGNSVGVKLPHRNIFLFQWTVCGLFALVSAHNSHLLISAEIGQQTFLVYKYLAMLSCTCTEICDLVLSYKHTHCMIAEPVYKLNTLLNCKKRHIVFLGAWLLNSNRYRNFFHDLVMIVLNSKLNEQADDLVYDFFFLCNSHNRPSFRW